MTLEPDLTPYESSVAVKSVSERPAAIYMSNIQLLVTLCCRLINAPIGYGFSGSIPFGCTFGSRFNPLMHTVAIWVQLQSILCQIGLSHRL